MALQLVLVTSPRNPRTCRAQTVHRNSGSVERRHVEILDAEWKRVATLGARRGDFDSAVRSLLALADCSGETLSATHRAASQRLHLLIALLGESPHANARVHRIEYILIFFSFGANPQDAV